MTRSRFLNGIKGHMDFVVYATVAIVILVIGMVMIGDPEEIGISVTTLSPAESSPAGSILTAIGGWLMFTFIISFIIHRRGEKESKYEIRATSVLLAKFLIELDRAEIETTQAFADLNKSTTLAIGREMLAVQGIEAKEVEKRFAHLSEALDKEVKEFYARTMHIRSKTEERLKKSCDFEMSEYIPKDMPIDEILKGT